MSYAKLPPGALSTRDARAALLDLKKLVDSAAEKIGAAERETVAVAVGKRQGDDPLRTLRTAAAALQSPTFDAAVSRVRETIKSAVAWHVEVQGDNGPLARSKAAGQN
jgi:hypothetical protein